LTANRRTNFESYNLDRIKLFGPDDACAVGGASADKRTDDSRAWAMAGNASRDSAGLREQDSRCGVFVFSRRTNRQRYLQAVAPRAVGLPHRTRAAWRQHVARASRTTPRAAWSNLVRRSYKQRVNANRARGRTTGRWCLSRTANAQGATPTQDTFPMARESTESFRLAWVQRWYRLVREASARPLS
jgi:hypothetical protein